MAVERTYIGIFGRCNAGKSTLLNLLTGAPTAVVSPEAGTTTDTVRKSCEIPGAGPVVFIDTAGTDDCSALGAQRSERTREAMRQVDLALLVFREWETPEQELFDELSKIGLSVLLVRNEWSMRSYETGSAPLNKDDNNSFPIHDFPFSITLNALDGDPAPLFEAIGKALPRRVKPSMFGTNVREGDAVVLVTPIDGAAPEGRLILPQVQAIRELLDRNAVAVAVQPEQLAATLARISPILIVADSQVLAEVRAAASGNIEVTTFSILLAAAKGDRELYEKGLAAVDGLKDGDRVLIAESCTHQSTCDDIGRVKIPRWLEEYTGARLEFTVVPGLAPLPPDIGDYALAVQCGGCMITRTQLLRRIRAIATANVPVTNYGMLINKIRK
jgi:[FeFe] hydrogenase H-cluster maturation GTPase HydF